MTRPAALERFVRPSAPAVLLATVVLALLVLDDVRLEREARTVDPATEVVVEGVVQEVGGDAFQVAYRHPVTDQEVRAEVWTWSRRPRPGEVVALVASRADPLGVEWRDDPYSWRVNLPPYAALVAAVAGLYGWRRWVRRRAAALAAAGPGRPMVGALRRTRLHPRRARLHLYEPDAPPGAAPACSLHVVTTAGAPFAAPFAVEVVGDARPLRHVVARHDGTVLWPAGPTLPRARHRRPTGGPVTDGRLVALPGPPGPLPGRRELLAATLFPLGGLLAAVVLLVVVGVGTWRGAGAAAAVERRGIEVVAEVVGHGGGDDRVRLRVERDEGAATVVAPAELASDYPVGLRLPIVVDPARAGEARLRAEPYDAALPVGSALAVVGIAALVVAGRAATWWRSRAAARRGPWWRAEATSVDHGRAGATVDLAGPGGWAVAAVRVPAGEHPAAADHTGPAAGAGDLDPGSPVAVWVGLGEPIPVLAALRAPTLAPVPVPRADGGPPVPGIAPDDALALRSYRWTVRRPHVEVADGEVRLTLPGWFGARPLVVPLAAVAVADLTADLDEGWDDDVDELDVDVVFAEPVAVPYLFTTGPMTDPTLLVLFRRPVRVPPLRPLVALSPSTDLPFGYAESRSEDGARVDGLLLRPESATAFAAALVAAGAEHLEDPDEFLRRHREVVDDPLLADELIADDTRRLWLVRAADALVAALVVVGFVLPDEPSAWQLGGIGACIVGSLGLRWRARRPRRPRRPDRRP